VKTKKRKPQQLLEVSSVGWKTVLFWGRRGRIAVCCLWKQM